MKNSSGLENVRITQFQLNQIISNKILLESSLLLFSRMSHLCDVKKIEQLRVRKHKQPRKKESESLLV